MWAQASCSLKWSRPKSERASDFLPFFLGPLTRGGMAMTPRLFIFRSRWDVFCNNVFSLDSYNKSHRECLVWVFWGLSPFFASLSDFWKFKERASPWSCESSLSGLCPFRFHFFDASAWLSLSLSFRRWEGSSSVCALVAFRGVASWNGRCPRMSVLFDNPKLFPTKNPPIFYFVVKLIHHVELNMPWEFYYPRPSLVFSSSNLYL